MSNFCGSVFFTLILITVNENITGYFTSYRCQFDIDTESILVENRDFCLPCLHLTSMLGGLRRNIAIRFGMKKKLELWSTRWWKNVWEYVSSFRQNTRTWQRVTTFREFWERSAHFGQNWGCDESRAARVFFVWQSSRPFGNFATADFHQIWPPNVVRCRVEESGKTFAKSLTLGVICRCPQNLKSQV